MSSQSTGEGTTAGSSIQSLSLVDNQSIPDELHPQLDLWRKIRAVYAASPPFYSDYHECWKMLRTRLKDRSLFKKVSRVSNVAHESQF